MARRAGDGDLGAERVGQAVGEMSLNGASIEILRRRSPVKHALERIGQPDPVAGRPDREPGEGLALNQRDRQRTPARKRLYTKKHKVKQ